MRGRIRWAVCCVFMTGCTRMMTAPHATKKPEPVVARPDRPVVPDAAPRPRERSEAELQEALALDLRDASAYEGLARLYHQRSRTQPSYAILAQQVVTQGTAMLARDGRISADLLTTRALLALDKGRPDQAWQDLLAAVDLDPGNLRAQSALGTLALQLHDDRRALAAFKIVVATPQGQHDAAAWRGLGLAELQLGDPAAAHAAYLRAAAAAPNDPQIQYDLARLAELRADASEKIPSDAESQEHYRRFVALSADDPRFADQRERALNRIANPKYWSCHYPIGTVWGTAQDHQEFDDRHERANAWLENEKEMAAIHAALEAADRDRLLNIEAEALAAEAAEATPTP